MFPKGFPDKNQEFIVIYTSSENNDRWKDAAAKISDAISEPTLRLGITLKVEIRNSNKMYQDISSAPQKDMECFPVLEAVQSEVEEQVLKRYPDIWTTIGCRMRGPRGQLADRIPTIIITTNPRQMAYWVEITRYLEIAIQVTLADLGSNIKIGLEVSIGGVAKTFFHTPTSPAVFRRETQLPRSATNGGSIGPRNCDNAGSIGAFVWYYPPGNLPRIPCFLTCYHVIREGAGVKTRDNDKNGIGLIGTSPQPTIHIDYPAKMDADATHRVLTKEIAVHASGEKTRILNTIQMYQSQAIATVKFGSGNHRNKNGRSMDWSLLEMDPSFVPSNFTGYNKVPEPAGGFTVVEIPADLIYTLGDNASVTQTGVLTAEGNLRWAAKRGRTTGVTAGEVGVRS
jgi:hypothetical protein